LLVLLQKKDLQKKIEEGRVLAMIRNH